MNAQELLFSTLACTKAKPDCLDCRVSTDVRNPTRILYTEQWSSEAAFIGHAASGEFKRVLNAIDLCSELPDIRVERLYTERGIECFQRILQQATDSKEPAEANHTDPKTGTDN